jgi:hypothetical protein
MVDLSPAAEDPIGYLQSLLHAPEDQARQMIADRDQVWREYGRLFHPDNLRRLTAEDFMGFLLYENNRHWWGIHRQRVAQTADMNRLRAALAVLLDESRPIEERLDWLRPRAGPKPIPGLGPAVMTPILHVVYPDRYGVWNSIAESAMTRLGLWPPFEWGWGFGQKYRSVNDAIRAAADALGVDLWTIDTLWWVVERRHEPTRHQFEGGGSSSTTTGTARRSRVSEEFLCSECYQWKPESRRSRSRSAVCKDCVEE